MGSRGFDQLYGGPGNDLLTASSRGSLLAGGAGNDALTGNFGDDTFIFDGGRDVIVFFDPEEDLIDVTAFGFDDVQDVLDQGSETFLSTRFTFGDDQLTVLGADLADFHAGHILA